MPSPDFKTTIETIRDHNEITDVIGSYVQLKRSGNSIKALCPFHREKTPSFNVNPSRQSFHCFGCGAGGDVFNFIMRHLNMDFMQAAKFLAERANLNVELEPQVGGAGGPTVSEKNDLFHLHVKLVEWYQRCLRESGQAETARRYLRERELGDDAVEKFAIGYAPQRDMDWAGWAKKRSFDFKLLVTAGILVEKEAGGWYDRFANRLMFPIYDDSARPIGFSGRLLPGDERPSKYSNSPATPIFIKSKVMYALHLAKRDIIERNEAILCEGQIDVIRCHLAGITNAIAAQGTAITEDHARILRRFCDSVRLVLDADDAGRNAAMKSSALLMEHGLNVRIASLPPGDDPDSLIRRAGGPAFLALIDRAVPALDFHIDTHAAQQASTDDAAALRTARAVLELVGKVPSDIQRDKMIQQTSTRLGVRPDILASEMKRIQKPVYRRAETDEAETTTAPAAPSHPLEELELLRLVIHAPQSAELLAAYILPEHIRSTTCRQIYAILLAHAYDEHFDLMAELLTAGEEARRVVAQLTAEDRFQGTEFNVEKTAQDIVMAIRRKDFELQRRQLEARRRQASGEEAKTIEMEMAEITLNLHTLRSGWEKSRPMLDLHRSLG